LLTSCHIPAVELLLLHCKPIQVSFGETSDSAMEVICRGARGLVVEAVRAKRKNNNRGERRIETSNKSLFSDWAFIYLHGIKRRVQRAAKDSSLGMKIK
jgi:hypothetical protein